MNLLRPYLAYIGAGVLLAAFLAVFLWGRGTGRDAQAKDDQERIDASLSAYEIAHTGLLNAGAALREVSAKTALEAAKAREEQAKGAELAADAKAAALASKDRVKTLEEQLKAERATCTESEMRICGVQLR